MTTMSLIPLPETVKSRVDIAAVPSTIALPFVSSIPWVEIAAFLGAVYTGLRILEFAVSRAYRLAQWLKARRITP